MQNVQNAAEIQQRVINLVELYRTSHDIHAILSPMQFGTGSVIN